MPELCPHIDLTQALLAANGYGDLFSGVSDDNVKASADSCVTLSCMGGLWKCR